MGEKYFGDFFRRIWLAAGSFQYSMSLADTFNDCYDNFNER